MNIVKTLMNSHSVYYFQIPLTISNSDAEKIKHSYNVSRKSSYTNETGNNRSVTMTNK